MCHPNLGAFSSGLYIWSRSVNNHLHCFHPTGVRCLCTHLPEELFIFFCQYLLPLLLPLSSERLDLLAHPCLSLCCRLLVLRIHLLQELLFFLLQQHMQSAEACEKQMRGGGRLVNQMQTTRMWHQVVKRTVGLISSSKDLKKSKCK